MNDQYLLNALRVLETQERLKNDKSAFMMGCPKEVFDMFRQHPKLGPWLSEKYPHTLGVIDAYFDEPVEDRNIHEDPFRYLISEGAPVRVMLVSNTDTTVDCEFPNWDDSTVHVVSIRNPAGFQKVGPAGSLYDFENPNSPYIEVVFLGDKAPLYTHALAVMMMEVTLDVMKSERGVAWSEVLAKRSIEANQ